MKRSRINTLIFAAFFLAAWAAGGIVFDLIAASPASAYHPLECNGIWNDRHGSAVTDFEHLGTGPNSYTALAGQDYIYGEPGDDNICGDGDPDNIYGGNDGDDVFGNGGSDSNLGEISGGPNRDHVSGNDGSDYLTGGDGDDVLHGGDGDDLLVGGAGYDVCHGGPGSDDLADSCEEKDPN